jgi:phosphoribosylformylglycinamidine synthase subunit PurL
VRADAFWFGESQSRVVVSVAKGKEEDFLKLTKGFHVRKLGVVTDGEFTVGGEDWGHVRDWKSKYDGSLAAHMEKLVEMETL